MVFKAVRRSKPFGIFSSFKHLKCKARRHLSQFYAPKFQMPAANLKIQAANRDQQPTTKSANQHAANLQMHAGNLQI
jgi:hypothetical protein